MQFKMKVAVDTGPSLMYTNHRAFLVHIVNYLQR